jgi:hypothetical protein
VMPTVPQPKAMPRPSSSASCPESIGPSSRADDPNDKPDLDKKDAPEEANDKPVVPSTVLVIVREVVRDDGVRDAGGAAGGLAGAAAGATNPYTDLQGAFNWSTCVCDNPAHDPNVYQKLIWSTWDDLPDPPCVRAAEAAAVGAATSTPSSAAASSSGPDRPMPPGCAPEATAQAVVNSERWQL